MDIGETVIPRIRRFLLLAGCIFVDGNCCDTIILGGITTPPRCRKKDRCCDRRDRDHDRHGHREEEGLAFLWDGQEYLSKGVKHSGYRI